MIDGYEACGRELSDWLVTHFLNWLCFQVDDRPEQFAVVVAGRTPPPCESFLGPDRYSRLVITIPSLSPLESEHVRELFELKGVSPHERDVEYLREKLAEGMSIKAALQLIEFLKFGPEDKPGG
jgi:hypothetical protein